MDPSLRIRLETHPEPNVRLDLLITRHDLEMYTVVELKYLAFNGLCCLVIPELTQPARLADNTRGRRPDSGKSR
jgi:hypothetical protein